MATGNGSDSWFEEMEGIIGWVTLGLVVGFAVGVAGLRIPIGPFPLGISIYNYVLGMIVGAVVGALVTVVSRARERARRAECVQEREQRQREQEAVLRQSKLDRLYTQIRTRCDESVQAFEQLPTDLSNTHGWTIKARQHFGNNAYSPFWHAIENAYGNLGAYNQRLTSISQYSRAYTEAVQKYIELGGTKVLPKFPVEVDHAQATQVAERSAQILNSLVYHAQRDAVFAQIWEQRRTTSAVIAGFANLEAAVDRISSALNASIASLSTSVETLSSEVSGIGSEIATASSNATALGTAQIHTHEQLNARVNKAVFYLREEHNRAIGLA